MPSVKKNFLYSSFLTSANYLFPLLTSPYISRVLGVNNAMGVNILGVREVAASKGNLSIQM